MNPEQYENTVDAELSARQERLLQQLEQAITTAASQIQDALERVPVGDETELQAVLEVEAQDALAVVNDQLRALLGADLEEGAPALWAAATDLLGVAINRGAGVGAEGWLRSTTMAGQTIEAWLRRRSPSPWMRSLLDGIGNAVRAGWERDQAARATAAQAASAFIDQTRTAAETLAQSALWQQADTVLTAAAGATGRQMEWTWRTRGDERVCSICGPLSGRTAATRRALPLITDDTHPRCRCVVVPAFV